MGDFVDIIIDREPSVILDAAITSLQASFAALGFPGWTPSDADLEIILLSKVAEMAADNANIASQMPAAAFRAFGTKLAGVPYNAGIPATVVTTWTLSGAPTGTIAAGTFLTIADLGFYVQSDVAVTAGDVSKSVIVVAVESGTTYNGLNGPAVLVNSIDWVTGITVIGATSGGSDQESDDDYQNRLAADRELSAPRPITATDFASFVLTEQANAQLPAGVVVGRSSAIDGFNPAATALTATRTSGSPNVSAVSSFTGLTAGSLLSGTGIPAGTYVVSVNTGASTLVMSANASSSVTTGALTSTGSYGNPRYTTTFVTDPLGLALSGPSMTALQTWLQTLREINFVSPVVAPTYTAIYVTYQVHPLPGIDPVGLVASVNQALLTYLNPAEWGITDRYHNGQIRLNSADGFSTVRYNKILGVIEAVPGCDYVVAGSTGLKIGTAPSPAGVADIILPGPAPLPLSDVTSPTIVGTAV